MTTSFKTQFNWCFIYENKIYWIISFLYICLIIIYIFFVLYNFLFIISKKTFIEKPINNSLQQIIQFVRQGHSILYN